MAIDKTIITASQPKVEKVKKNVDDANSFLSRLIDLAQLYDGIANSSFTTYVVVLDNVKYDVQEIISSTEFKDIFLSIVEKKYNNIAANLKAIVDKNGNGSSAAISK